jgi:hypothetical protein
MTVGEPGDHVQQSLALNTGKPFNWTYKFDIKLGPHFMSKTENQTKIILQKLQFTVKGLFHSLSLVLRKKGIRVPFLAPSMKRLNLNMVF